MGKNSGEDLLYEKKDGRATITFNRPEVHNSFTSLMLMDLVDAILDASADNSVGVVVIRGAGDQAFSSGGDVKWEKEARQRGSDFDKRPIEWREPMRRCLKPIIAAVKGYAIGGGNHLAYGCDLTLAADNAVFGQVGPKVGSPIAGYVPASLVAIVGQKKAREMWYLCRRYSAEEALEMGLINFVVPLADFDAELDTICEEILTKSPTVLRLLKWSFDKTNDHMRAYNDNRMVTYWIAPDFNGSEESMEGATAFLEKRPPDYKKYRK